MRDGVGDFDGAGFEVDLGPEDGEGFADADAGADHEGDQVGEIGLDGPFVGGQARSQEAEFHRLVLARSWSFLSRLRSAAVLVLPTAVTGRT